MLGPNMDQTGVLAQKGRLTVKNRQLRRKMGTYRESKATQSYISIWVQYVSIGLSPYYWKECNFVIVALKKHILAIFLIFLPFFLPHYAKNRHFRKKPQHMSL